MMSIRKSISKIVATICAVCMISFCFALTNLKTTFDQNFANAQTTNFEETYSIFIVDPTYSTLFNSKLYFIDNFDNMLKIYDTDTGSFSSDYVAFDDSADVVAVSACDGFLFILQNVTIIQTVFENNVETEKTETTTEILVINLETLASFKINSSDISTSYTQISATNIIIENAEYFAISLTPTQITDETFPIVLLASKSSFDTNLSSDDFQDFNLCKIDISNISENIKNSIFKVFVIESETTGNVDIIFFYGSNVSFSSTAISNIQSNQIAIKSVTVLNDNYSSLDNSSSKISIIAINMMNINNEDYFLITYSITDNGYISYYSSLYSFYFNANDSTKTSFSSTEYEIASSSPYVLTSENFVICPDDQNILTVKITYDSGTFNDNTTIISNPKITLEYFDEDDFVYLSTTTQTALLSSPWDSEPTINIDARVDIIWIANGKIESDNYVINDFKFCLYTANGTNYLGYIRSQAVSEKAIVTLDEYKLSANIVFKVVPSTNLYSLPTKVSSSIITNTLSSYVIMQIQDNSRVEVLDAICLYTCQNVTFLKVQVNGDKIGYIEQSSIVASSNLVDYVITNASLKSDTTVYLEENYNGAVIETLASGYRVRMNGTRDAQTGFVSITYNDEYGNEFTGYILTDLVSSDSWSTLQIIGLILIAISVGLLILILVFKRDYIGKSGQKYEKSKKSNVKEDELTNETRKEEKIKIDLELKENQKKAQNNHFDGEKANNDI